MLPPGIPNNEGVFRAIEVICPPGTIANGVLPAACAARGLTGFRMVDCMFGALAKMLPDKVMAAADGGNTGISIGGYDAERKPFIYVDFTCGAWGGRPWADGLDGNSHMFANMASQSVEVTEAEQPIQILAYEFVPDKAGAGKYRGGAPFRRDYRFLEDEGDPAGALRPARPPPVRPLRRQPGQPSRELPQSRTARTASLPSKLTMTMRRGDVFRHEMAGAGGWGDPLERDPGAVLQDVRNELLSRRAGAQPTTAWSIDAQRWAVDDGGDRSAAPRSAPRAAGATCRRCSAHDPACRSSRAIGDAAMSDVTASASTSAARSPTSCCSATTARLHTKKVSSSVDDYARAIVEGSTEVFARRRSPAARSRRSATARRSPPTRSSSTRARATGLITTKGFRDVLEIRKLRMPRLYDMRGQSRRRWSSATCAQVVDERVNAQGGVERPLDRGRRRARGATRCSPRGSRRSRSACCNSYANPAHELRIKDDRRAPGARAALLASAARCCRRSRSTSAPRRRSSTPM